MPCTGRGHAEALPGALLGVCGGGLVVFGVLIYMYLTQPALTSDELDSIKATMKANTHLETVFEIKPELPRAEFLVEEC